MTARKLPIPMPELIYLDQLHWINLTKARLDQAGSEENAEALAKLRMAITSGRAVVPISSTHYMETSKIASAQRRADLALTMGELSGYTALTSREVLLGYELRRSLAEELGVNYAAPPPPVTGYGFAHAFGEPTVVGRIRGDQAEIEDWTSQNAPEIIARLEEFFGFGWRFVPSGNATSPMELVNEAFNAVSQFWMLMGPDNKRDPELLKAGFNPGLAYDVVGSIARREADLAKTLRANPARGQALGDIVAVRALYWDLAQNWDRATSDVWPRVMSMDEFDKDRLSRILGNIPIVDIESSIRRANFRNSSKGWESNDIYDLNFVGSAVAYCDVVVTEKHLHAQLDQEGIGRKYGTTVLKSLERLTEHLRRSSVKAPPI
jgi:hypothetical protein